MATQVQNRRGSTAEHSTFTGANGELTVDTTKKTVVVHDGTTAGGVPLLRENGSQNAVTTGTSTAASFIPTSSTVPTNGVYLPSANNVAISTNGTGRLFVDSSGKVGTGVAPNYTQHIKQNTTYGFGLEANGDDSRFLVGNVSSTWRIAASYDTGGSYQPITLFTSDLERLRITSAGLVGVGTSSPSQLFHVSGGQARVSTGAKANSNNYLVLGTTDSTNPMELIFSNITNSYWSIQSVEQGISLRPLVLNPSGGNVGVGTTSPAYALDVASVVAQVGDLTDAFIQYKSTAGNWHVGANSSNAYVFYSGTYGSGSERARIDSSGRLLVGTSTSQGAYNLQCFGTGVWGQGAYVNGSDANIKQNIQDLEPALDIIKAMRPVTFQYKEEYSSDQTIQPGFIAQELQEAMAGKAYVDGVVQQGTTHLNVAYSSIIAVLVKAVQELEAKVAALEGA